MSLSKSQQIFAENIGRLIIRANAHGVKLTFGEAYRTKDQQYLYYKGFTISPTGELVKANVHSWTMQSNHLHRLAVDFNFFIDGKLTYDPKEPKLIDLGEYWESLHAENRWGGFWKRHDTPHFEMNI